MQRLIYQLLRCHHRDADHDFPELSLVMRQTAFCLWDNKDTDQLRGNREVTADQLISAFVLLHR